MPPEDRAGPRNGYDVLYLTYNGLTEPLGRRQVLPYVAALAARGHRFTVVSFEKTGHEALAPPVRELLRSLPVEWIPLPYHRWPTLPASAYDCTAGIRAGLRKRSFDLVHARSALPAAMARALSMIRRWPWIYDVRGLVAEEYVDGGHWSSGSALFRLTAAVERRLLRRAPGLVFLTERIRRDLIERGVVRAEIPQAVIPCCVDLEVFRPSPADRQRVRQALGLEEQPVLVYSGSLGSWYLIDEMMSFYAVARDLIPGLRFLVITPQPHLAEGAARRAEVANSVIVRQVSPDDVPAHLAAADAGICLLMNRFSKRASSPTKYAEYLASGLPVVTDSWTGDAQLLSRERSWILTEGLSPEHYRPAARRLREVLADPDPRARARSLAHRSFALPLAVARYEELYSRVVKGRDPR